MLHRSRIVLLLWLGLGLAAPCWATEGDPAGAWSALRAEAAMRLASLAREAHAKRLFLTRDEIYTEVLAFDSDHAKARSWLKYTRRDGAWVRARYTPPRNRGSKAARAAQAGAREDWISWWREDVARVHREAERAGARDVASEIVRFALAFRGEDPAMRALAGEVRHGEEPDACWVLVDTQQALTHRARFLHTARRAVRAVRPSRPGPPVPADRPEGQPWTTVLVGETVRVLGSVSASELRRHHEIAEAAAAVFSAVFGVDARLLSRTDEGGLGADDTFALYVFPTRAEGNAFLAAEPGVGSEGLAVLAELDLGLLPERHGAVVKTALRAQRWEATAHAMHAHFTAPHLGHTTDARGAWAQEVVSLYLAWLQVRTRSLCRVGDAATASASQPPSRTGPFGRPRRNADEGTVQLEDGTTDWHARAAEAIRELPLDALREMTVKPASSLDALDLLAGYGLAVYVLEAHPEVSAGFFRDIATQTKPDVDAALVQHFGTNLEALRPHLLRWLDEMGRLAPPPGELRAPRETGHPSR